MIDFEPAADIGIVQAGVLREKSYMRHSSYDDRYVLIGNDGGNAAGLYLVEIETGKLVGTFLLPYNNRDTESAFTGPIRNGVPTVGLW